MNEHGAGIITAKLNLGVFPANHQELLEFVWDMAVSILKDRPDGSQPAVAILQLGEPNGEFLFVHMGDFMTDARRKDSLVQVLHEIARKESAVGFAIVMEAWSVRVEKGDKGKIDEVLKAGASSMPEKIEVLVVEAQHQSGETVAIGEIKRAQRCKRVVDVVRKHEEGVTVQSRFQGIITRGNA
jgi:hypothetical protein